MRPIKRGFLIGPWGVGAIVPFPNNESLMIAGLDVWEYKGFEREFVIDEPRLCQRLGTSELRLPPDFRDSRAAPAGFLKIPAIRFPRWHYCPICGLMQKVTSYSETPRCQGLHERLKGNRKPILLPETIVVACSHGHINDFPVAEWLHESCGAVYNPNQCKIRRRESGNVSSVASVTYECSCGANAYLNPTAAFSGKLPIKCSGAMPWLGVGSSPCVDAAFVVNRDATSLWQGEVRSSLYIPTEDVVQDRRVLDALDSVYKTLSEMKRNGADVTPVLQFTAVNSRVDPVAFTRAFERRYVHEVGMGKENLKEVCEDEYRENEYRVLIKSSGGDSQAFHSIACDLRDYAGSLMRAFSAITLVPKLKETRALVGFRRSLSGKRGLLAPLRSSANRDNWLPAISVFGEGIFVEFDQKHLKSWSEQPAVMKRVALLHGAYRDNRASEQWRHGSIRPEFVLLHTFAHLLINELTFSCGYGAASLRERLYCGMASNAERMSGVLVYTASGDADGSLGGLVHNGSPGLLEELIEKAVEKARWCSRDPICIQSHGQGPGSCNLAACHSCALLPETCCEFGNGLLDRGLVIGTMEDPSVGYFNFFR